MNIRQNRPHPKHASSAKAQAEPMPGVEIPDWSAFGRAHFARYEHHPHYASLIASAKPADRVRALLRFAASFLVIKIKRAIHYELISTDIRAGRDMAGRMRLLMAALSNLGRTQAQRNFDTEIPGSTPLHRRLARLGCAVVTMPEPALARIRASAAPNFESLARRRAAEGAAPRAFEASRAYATRAQSAQLFDAIEAVFRQTGVLEGASAYLGRQARLVDVNPQINDASDNFWQRIFPDKSGPLPSTAYFHRDASGGDIKAIIYLSDVGPDNGPFSFAVGSHRIRLTRTDDHICEANDSNGMASTDLLQRRAFAALPGRLRQKGAFGNDLTDQDPASAALLKSVWPITAPAGSVVVFDTKGIHRGGMVLQGERRVITCVIG